MAASAATKFINGHRLADFVTGTGIDGGALVRIFNGQDGTTLQEFQAFPPGTIRSDAFSGDSLWSSGVRVGVTDVNHDGIADLVAAPGRGRASAVRIIDGDTLELMANPVPFDSSFLGGVFVGGQ